MYKMGGCMEKLERIIFVARSGTCREPMAMGILDDLTLKLNIEILARGLVLSRANERKSRSSSY